ncbi:Lrp/AsnC family transcriptional regulator [Natrialba asiatica]|uniref:Transcriptional regulator, AsnC family protein n=1 Tax=Natrialba asiatica (strain ATCC 700177 / DSM 12278 / JCM 9576 / FERM P-10747 / NBRC 102637 / 172P1) TaxID=29540 RepID=M0AIE3_NATA1|nr:Lrp/AsnC family transcriptional regulator [Natrialba asiatica]ELY97153.1 transcriptional regulator, AsnC family protein [Natrialba asiatica DSM 12278]
MADASNGETGTEEPFDGDTIDGLLSDHLDDLDYEIYRILNENGRISDTELGERVGLSRTAVRRRRKQLQEDDIIKVIGVLVLQEADLNYADVRVTITSNATREAVDEFIDYLVDQELVYEVDEYLGTYDILVRIWHASLQDIKTYTDRLMQHEAVEDYDVTPVSQTYKAWHSVIDESSELPE